MASARNVHRRSTKAGASTPATRGQQQRSEGFAKARSTKAGASTPATHPYHVQDRGAVRPRSTKAGASTPATPVRQRRFRARVGIGRSTKAGASTPATPGVKCDGLPPLPAQRRPGHQPRRHSSVSDILRDLATRRSTKAGASTPATPEAGRLTPASIHARSTKAGASTPATPSAVWTMVRRPWKRSTKAGASTPATPEMLKAARKAKIEVAQRRPGHQPRRHISNVLTGQVLDAPRSTKAGASTPATRLTLEGKRSDPEALNEGRGINPGDTSLPMCNVCIPGLPAQRRPGHQPRRHIHRGGCSQLNFVGRSTKAGASTPATPVANVVGVSVKQFRSTKAGASTPATRLAVWSTAHPGFRSTKAGASTPATLTADRSRTSTPAVVVGAQRRPGHQPRRHAHNYRSA